MKDWSDAWRDATPPPLEREDELDRAIADWMRAAWQECEPEPVARPRFVPVLLGTLVGLAASALAVLSLDRATPEPSLAPQAELFPAHASFAPIESVTDGKVELRAGNVTLLLLDGSPDSLEKR